AIFLARAFAALVLAPSMFFGNRTPKRASKRGPQPPEGREVQDLRAAFANVCLDGWARSVDNLDRIIREELWRKCRKEDGSDFQSFPEWVAHPKGLGVDTQSGAEFLRTLLLDIERVDIWALTLEYIRVRQGRRRN